MRKTNLLEGILTSIIDENIEAATSFTLINNAGIVDPIGLVGNVQAEGIEKSIAVNLTAPMILSNTFIEKLRNVTYSETNPKYFIRCWTQSV